MDIEHEERPQAAVFRLIGNLEIYATEDLKECLVRPVQEGRYPRVVVDLSRVDFVDSTGLGLLMHMQFKLKESRFRFCGVKENIRLSLEYTNLAHFFAIDADEHESLSKFDAS